MLTHCKSGRFAPATLIVIRLLCHRAYFRNRLQSKSKIYDFSIGCHLTCIRKFLSPLDRVFLVADKSIPSTMNSAILTTLDLNRYSRETFIINERVCLPLNAVIVIDCSPRWSTACSYDFNRTIEVYATLILHIQLQQIPSGGLNERIRDCLYIIVISRKGIVYFQFHIKLLSKSRMLK